MNELCYSGVDCTIPGSGYKQAKASSLRKHLPNLPNADQSEHDGYR